MQEQNQIYKHMSRKHNSNLHTVRRSNKVLQATCLPKVMNLNPRSIYNKLDEFVTFVEEQDIDLVCMSESHERAYPTKAGKNQTLSDIIEIDNYQVISNPNQRLKKHKGGRPAIVVNKNRYQIRDLQKDNDVDIPWGVEAVWAELTLKNVTNASTIQKIIVGSIYSKPGSRSKNKLLDHISEVYNYMSTKHQHGLQWIICGDTKDHKIY